MKEDEKTMKNADQIMRGIQAEGNESAHFALMDNPTMLAAVEAAFDAGARWSKYEGSYGLSEPGSMETLVIIDPSDDTADFGSSIRKYVR